MAWCTIRLAILRKEESRSPSCTAAGGSYDVGPKNVSGGEDGESVSQSSNEVSGSKGLRTKQLAQGACRSAAAPKRERRRRRERGRDQRHARLSPRLSPGARRLHSGSGEAKERG